MGRKVLLCGDRPLREGKAPAEPRAGNEAVWLKRLSRSFALPAEGDAGSEAALVSGFAGLRDRQECRSHCRLLVGHELSQWS